MAAVTLICGDEVWPLGHPPAPAWSVSRRPDKAELAPVIDDPSFADVKRVIVCGDDSDLAAVARRLLQKDRLDVEVAFVPSATAFTSVVCRLYDLPLLPEKAAYFAQVGNAGPVPLIRDDSGGVLLGMGVLSPVEGTAYCDEELILRGTLEAIEVYPDPDHGLLVKTIRGRNLRKRRLSAGVKVFHGRALQLGLEPTTVLRDGAPGETPDKWTWYRHTADLLLVQPDADREPPTPRKADRPARPKPQKGLTLREQVQAQRAQMEAEKAARQQEQQ